MEIFLRFFFDADYYLRQIDESPADPYAHFVEVGDELDLDPSPYFNTNFYKNSYPDWNMSGERTALENFIAQEEAGDYRKPHPLIDPNSYLDAYPDLAEGKVHPNLHFAQHGDGEGRRPSKRFDPGFYSRCYLRLGQMRAFRHYVEQGRLEHLLPVPETKTYEASRQAAWDATWHLANPIVLSVHDAQAAGAPILLLDIAKAFCAAGYSPCFIFLNGGPLLDEFRRLGPVFLLAEGWNGKGLFSGIRKQAPALVNSAAAVEVARFSASTGHHTVLLIHEMRGYLDQQSLMPGLMAVQALGARLIASLPRMVVELQAELGELPHLQPGIVQPSLRFSQCSAVHRRFKDQTLFIGAGYADRRKGFDLFLQTCHMIQNRLDSSVFVWLGSLDSWAQGLAAQAQADGLRLILPGFVSDSAAWYREAAAYLLTSREDAGPTTLAHAAAVGTGFVGFAENIGLRGLADPLGVFVPPGDMDGFVEEVLRLAREDSQARRRFRRDHIRKNTSFATYCNALLELLKTERL
ncbi:glycosyltransferase [Ottowia thiooxydans]|uniref:glycosyltransferase n=1 Tax=Ottowia thiooxydans TaxID=219182 RepID=UPI0004158004|nr:glycosyltransferase [Ottowia thiooxydans]